jgi:mannosyl-oligosaccharide alpha-1,2-mannosidase
MSFQLPSRIPAFDSAQREIEDGYWRATNPHNRGSSSYANSNGLDITTKIGNFINPSRDLPMYKDKPYFNPRRPSRGRRSRALWLVICLVFGFILWVFWSGKSPDGVRHPIIKSMHGGEMWSWVKSFDRTGKGQGAGKDAVNWDERRERVKDAFLVSWEGYEKDAWGEE